MVSTALFFDALQGGLSLIPFLGWIVASLVGGFAFMTFWFWFKTHGVKFTTAKRAGIMGGGFFIELIPILNMLPAWTLSATLTIFDVWKEDAKKDKKDSTKKAQGATQNMS